MAQDSRNIRRKRRLRRNVTLANKQVRTLQGLLNHSAQNGAQAIYTLLSVLVQNGPVTITKGTIDQTVAAVNAGELKYEVVPADPAVKEPTEYLVRTVEVKVMPEPAVTVTKVEDETDTLSYSTAAEIAALVDPATIVDSVDIAHVVEPFPGSGEQVVA